MPKVNGVSIIEHRFGGHRLAYVAAIVRANNGRSPVVLHTCQRVVDSIEFATHLSELVTQKSLAVVVDLRTASLRKFLTLMRTQQQIGNVVVIPEADGWLFALVATRLFQFAAPRTVAIVMRPPPDLHLGNRGSAVRLCKTMLLKILLHFPKTIDLFFLEDPLATGSDRVWAGRFAEPGNRLDDPADILAGTNETFPAELTHLTSDQKYVALIGSIDQRKRLPLILEAWSLIDPSHAGQLVVAGSMTPSVRQWWTDNFAEVPSGVTVIDRYLSNNEISGLLKNAQAIFVLNDGGLSSGLLTAAAYNGRWTICLKGSRTGRVAEAHGFGCLVDDSPGDLAVEIHNVLGINRDPPPTDLQDSQAFGLRVLRSVVSENH